MPFEIIRNDITKVKADAIVNTANPLPVVGHGTDSAVYEAAGFEKLLAERKKIGNIARGNAAATPAFDLKAKYIIHTVGPVWDGGSKGEFDILRSCYENSLELALKLKCRSVAFPLIATGVYGFPKDKALSIATSAIQSFLLQHEMKVILVVFDPKSFVLSGRLIENIREYVDAHYVREARLREYTPEDELSDRLRRESECIRALHDNRAAAPAGNASERPAAASGKKTGIKEMLASSDKTFQEKLFEIIDERGLTGPQVYKHYVSKQVFSKIQSDKDYHPNKFTALALCLSLHLDIDQTLDLIGRAGWTLSKSSKADLVVRWCIINKEYNLVKINIYLFDAKCSPLDKIK